MVEEKSIERKLNIFKRVDSCWESVGGGWIRNRKTYVVKDKNGVFELKNRKLNQLADDTYKITMENNFNVENRVPDGMGDIRIGRYRTIHYKSLSKRETSKFFRRISKRVGELNL